MIRIREDWSVIFLHCIFIGKIYIWLDSRFTYECMFISITMIIKRKWKNKWLTPFAVLPHIHRSSHVIMNGNTFSCQMTIEVSKVSIHIYENKHAFLLNSMENKETHAAIMKTSFFDYYCRVFTYNACLSIYPSFTLSKFNRCWVQWPDDAIFTQMATFIHSYTP